MTFTTIKEQLLEMLTSCLDQMSCADDPKNRIAYFNQAFGAVEFTSFYLATNSKEMLEIQKLWENEWYKEFTKILYKTP